MKTKVKICCISSINEATLAIKYGAAVIGLVGPMPSGPGIISNELIKHIASKIPQTVDSFLLTSETTSSRIFEHYSKVKTTAIQIVDKVELHVYSELREMLPAVKLIQVIHVLDEKSIDHALELDEAADFLLLDSGNPNLDVKELGGTGRTHNWEISREIVNQCKTPVFLAGGLNPTNVKEAITKVKPFGVDICSGVRSNGNLDESELAAFFHEIS